MGIRRHTSAARRGWTDSHLRQLSCGWDFFRDAWGEDSNPAQDMGQAEREADMRGCWETHRDKIIAAYAAKVPCDRPWAFWAFDQQWDESIHEEEQLHRLGLLSAEEIDLRRKRDGPPEQSHGYAAFRRPWSWWHDHGGRDYSTSEAKQLAQMEALTDWERQCMAKPDATAAQIISHRTTLTERERHFIGLPDKQHGQYPARQTFRHTGPRTQTQGGPGKSNMPRVPSYAKLSAHHITQRKQTP